MTPLTWAAFLMPRCSAIHAWETVVFFHSTPASNTFRGSVQTSPTNSSLTRFATLNPSSSRASACQEQVQQSLQPVVLFFLIFRALHRNPIYGIIQMEVPRRGLEPLCLAAPDPKSGASANFATSAKRRVIRLSV